MRTQALFMHTHPCSSVYMDTWSNLRMCVKSLCTQTQVHICILALRNPILTILTPFSLILSPGRHFNALFSPFCRPCLLSQVKVAPTVLLHSIGSWLRRPGATYVLRPSSLLSACCQRPLLVPSQCSAWLRGVGTLPTPSILLAKR